MPEAVFPWITTDGKVHGTRMAGYGRMTHCGRTVPHGQVGNAIETVTCGECIAILDRGLLSRGEMAKQEEEARADAALSVLGYYGYPGAGWFDPSSFYGVLLHAYQKADPGNKARLRAGFPHHAAAMDMVSKEDDGIKKLAATVNL